MSSREGMHDYDKIRTRTEMEDTAMSSREGM